MPYTYVKPYVLLADVCYRPYHNEMKVTCVNVNMPPSENDKRFVT